MSSSSFLLLSTTHRYRVNCHLRSNETRKFSHLKSRNQRILINRFLKKLSINQLIVAALHVLDWRDVKGEMRLEMCVFVSSSGLNLFFPRLHYLFLFKAGCGRSETVTDMKLAGKDSRLGADGSGETRKGKRYLESGWKVTHGDLKELSRCCLHKPKHQELSVVLKEARAPSASETVPEPRWSRFTLLQGANKSSLY